MALSRTLLCGLALFLCSCSAPEPPLRVGLLLWPPYELTVLAQQKDWYPEGSLRILEYRSPIQLSRAFRNGQVDVALTTSHISLSLAHDGIDHRIIYLVDHSQGGDALLARPEITELSDLEGEPIGVEPSPLGMYVFSRVISRAGLSRDDVKVVPLDIPQQLAAYENGRVDAVVTYEPVRSQLLETGARELFSSRDIPREIIDVVIARPEVIENQGERLGALLEGMDRALRFLREDPDEALPLMAARTEMSAEEFYLALEGADLFDMDANRRWMSGESSRLVEALQTQMRHMRDMGMLDEAVDLENLIELRFLADEEDS